MFDRLMGNLWGDGTDDGRDSRIAGAWKSNNELEKKEDRFLTSEEIAQVIIGTTFNERHFQQWPLWCDKKDTGTILLIGDISFDLTAQMDSYVKSDEESAVSQARKRLFETLSNFTDPFVDPEKHHSDYIIHNFKYSVTAWEGALSRPIISDDKTFDLRNLEDLEHVVSGEVDESGIFKGKIKAFSKWLDGEVTIIPKTGVPTHKNSKVGSFHLEIGTFEDGKSYEASYSTLSKEVWNAVKERARLYAGFMVYRNGLRVMPYGREDNDFFEIEKRRSFHAGREFGSNRKNIWACCHYQE